MNEATPDPYLDVRRCDRSEEMSTEFRPFSNAGFELAAGRT